MALDTIANLIVSASSALIAGAALRVSYLQGVGLEPIALVTGSTIDGVPQTKYFRIRLELDFWNRRKHPVLLKNIDVHAEGIEPREAIYPDERFKDEMIWAGNFGWKSLDEVIDAAKRSNHIVDIYFEHRDLKKLRAEFKFELRFYDPISARNYSVTINEKFMSGGLGWKTGNGSGVRDSFENHLIESAIREQKLPSRVQQPLGI
jgi:hypothetical protein